MGAPSVVNLDIDASINNLQLGSCDTLNFNLGTQLEVSGTQIINAGQININSGGGQNALLELANNVTLSGAGTLTLSNSGAAGVAIIYQATAGLTLTNQSTIQGAGTIGFDGLSLINQDTVDANASGQTLNLASMSNGINNAGGLLSATNCGILNIDGVTVAGGGTLTANTGGTVQLAGGTTIQGAILNNIGGTLGTLNGNSAFLDGSTAAGAITINGTYTNGVGSNTYVLGTINNQGNILLNGGSGNNSDLEIDSGTVTLKGGGTVTLSTAGGGGNALILQAAGGSTLENFNNTIQGAGIIGDNGLSLLNDAAGTVLANAPGQTLTINGGGTATNNGTFQANSSSALVLGNVTFTNFAGNTLTGGTYNVYGTVANPGTLQIDPLGNTGGEIVNNAATILLDGPNSNFVDSASLDALSNFSNNEATGGLTIQNGRNFTSPSNVDFANAGAVVIGANSTFTTGGTGDYNQSGGSTKLDGSLVAGGGQANFNGGSLYGNGGTIAGNVLMAGTIGPGDILGTAGTLNIHGNYTQTAAGIFDLGIGGLNPGTQFGLLNITGSALINGALNSALLNGYLPSVGNTFTFIDAGSVSGEFADVNGLNIGHGFSYR